MALRALLFDVDGTMADTEPQGHLPAYNRAFKELGLGWKWSKRLYRRLLLLPGGRERIDHYLSEHAPELGEHRDRVEQDREAWVESLHRLKSRHFRGRLEAGEVQLRPGVRRLMSEAGAARLQLALVTNASRASLKPFLEHILEPGLRDHVDVIVSGEEVDRKKPAPDLYHLALRRLKRRSDECIALEDSAMGLAAAREAGIPVVVTVNADTRDQDFPGALLVADQLGEPGAPCRVLQGGVRDVEYVDVPLLRRLLAEAEPLPRAAGS
jgi:HAD superfamily hydrolase (TIGR01509 family)